MSALEDAAEPAGRQHKKGRGADAAAPEAESFDAGSARIRPPASAYFLSDLTFVAAWSLIATIGVTERAAINEMLGEPGLSTTLVLGVGAALSAFIVIAMLLRRLAPSLFALNIDSAGLRWRDPYLLFFMWRLPWRDVELFHAPSNDGVFGATRYHRRGSLRAKFAGGPSSLDRPLPSNFGMHPKKLAELLEKWRSRAAMA